MVQKKLRSVVFVFIVLALLAGSFLVGRSFADRRVSHAQSEGAPADPNFSSFYCSNVDNVASWDNRIHLRCASVNIVGEDDVRYYAYPTGSFAGYTASRMLAVAQTALVLNKGVWIYYEASRDYNPTGCNLGDCRLIVGLSMNE